MGCDHGVPENDLNKRTGSCSSSIQPLFPCDCCWPGRWFYSYRVLQPGGVAGKFFSLFYSPSSTAGESLRERRRVPDFFLGKSGNRIRLLLECPVTFRN